MNIRYLALGFVAFLCAWSASAEIPANYYSKCENKGGQALLEALEDAISNHTDVGYNGLWTLYASTDVDANGKIWDMYSTKRWTYKEEQCGNYQQVGDCYNREHSMPKSWFNDQSPMVSDAFHIYPTDGKVNGQRSNYPYGECANGTRLSAPSGIQALGKLGACTFDGYSGTVFEPDDQYKGDFARSYFYMAACYNTHIDDWDSPMLAGNNYPGFTTWAVNLLLKWHRQDPVSQKELDRNEAIYAHQHNRNPFIDHPEMAEYVWGNKKTETWSSDTPVDPDEPEDPELTSPTGSSTFPDNSVGSTASISLTVKGTGLTEDVALSIVGSEDITLSRSSIPADEAISGASVTLYWTPKNAGQMQATLKITSGEASLSHPLYGTATENIVAYPANDITEDSFLASWTFIGDSDDEGEYTVWVWKQASGSDNSAPGAIETKVKADDCSATIDGLEASMAYSYQVCTAHAESNIIYFSTIDPMPSIEYVGSVDISLEATVGEPSQAAEVQIVSNNLSQPIKAKVNAPFQISIDKSNWAVSLTMAAEETHFYVRIYSETAGNFTSSVTLQSGEYVNDDLTLNGVVSESGSLQQLEKEPIWDAYCLNGALVIEGMSEAKAKIYSVDGTVWYDSTLALAGKQMAAGQYSFSLPSGLYIVALDTPACAPKRVLVK